MIRFTLNRSVLAATFCALALSTIAPSLANAAAPMSVAKRQANELKQLQAQDVNNDITPIGMAHKQEKKEEGCKFADKSSKDVVAVADAKSVTGQSTGGATGSRTTTR